MFLKITQHAVRCAYYLFLFALQLAFFCAAPAAIAHRETRAIRLSRVILSGLVQTTESFQWSIARVDCRRV